MRYSFKDFEFDSESLVLRQSGQSLAIRHNEAKVLALLLEQADKVFSKEEILSLVWQDKVVSEQAVFQNISHLRNLFGNDAIKTFPKRGYQWQLAANSASTEIKSTEQQSSAIAMATSANNLPTISPSKKQRTTKDYWPYALLISMVIIIIVSFNFTNKTTPANKAVLKKIAYIPISHAQDDQDFSIADNEQFDFTVLSNITTDEFHNNLELTYPELAQTHPLILTAQIRSHNQHSYIDFLVKGPSGDWQGQLSGDSTTDVIQQLQQHLQQQVIYDLLNTAQPPELKQANLSIAHQQSPNDLIILGALIDVYIMMNELEKAMVMADKLANISEEIENWQHLGNALLFQSKVLTRKELYELSSHKLTTAISYFEQIDDLKRQADAWYAHSWLDHQEDDYPAIKKSLLKSVSLSLQAKDIPRELDALTYLSILAYKHSEADDKYLYLQQAENKMKSYQLPIYHFAKIPFHYAFFAKTTSDKEPHWEQVLEYTKLTPDHWVAQSSRKALMRHFLKQNRLSEAKALLDNIKTNNAHNSYLHALLAQANLDSEQFNLHAQRSFEQARLAGETRLSLDIALLLCSEPNAQVNYDFYSQYINDNADNNWRRNNKEKLLALNF
ncbi:winged helix-turn-helix domain-containing protein [Colwellia psychrerythraea]|uniref:Transcriptional regulator, CadC n=1 Tax=Colwellia psychrerythraea TaxID=28229 RepID=A0A099KLR0_COLPS|nr:winged helix-turn-helix domain-containing protein [Colwellia psychrerythraea]KGJ90892.1 transcriptional regulator, CadC [Colwellia psychrerythraea]